MRCFFLGWSIYYELAEEFLFNWKMALCQDQQTANWAGVVRGRKWFPDGKGSPCKERRGEQRKRREDRGLPDSRVIAATMRWGQKKCCVFVGTSSVVRSRKVRERGGTLERPAAHARLERCCWWGLYVSMPRWHHLSHAAVQGILLAFSVFVSGFLDCYMQNSGGLLQW